MGVCCSTSNFAEGYKPSKHVNSIRLIKELHEVAQERWNALPVGKDDKVEVARIQEALAKWSPYVSASHAQKVMQTYNVPKYRMGFYEFRNLFVEYHLSLPSSAPTIFEASLKNPKSGFMTASELGVFISNHSGGLDHFKLSELDSMITFYQQNASRLIVGKVPRGAMMLEAFAQLLVDSRVNSYTDRSKLKSVYQDMSHPLSEYYIASSHNSSLLGNQLTSRSSGEAIRRALLLGVRMIELDAWEGEDGEPIITHGHTLVVPTSFAACIEVVREVGFKTSEYPLILTIENHCSLGQQRRQAEILRDVLGPMLYRYNRDFTQVPLSDLMQGEDEWLSPQELKGKIIIRDKPMKKPRRRDDRAGRRASAFLEMHRRRSAGFRPDMQTVDNMSATVVAMARASLSYAAKSLLNGSGTPESDEVGSSRMDKLDVLPGIEEDDEDDVVDDDDDDEYEDEGDSSSNHAIDRRASLDRQASLDRRASHVRGDRSAALRNSIRIRPSFVEEQLEGGSPTGGTTNPSPGPTTLQRRSIDRKFSGNNASSQKRLSTSFDDGEPPADFSLPVNIIMALSEKYDRHRSVAKRVSARLARTLRPRSVDLARSSSAILSSSSSSSNASEDDDQGELDLDDLTVTHLELISESVKARSADPSLLALMYIKNVKLRYKISPFGIDFEQPQFRSSSSIDERKLATLTKYPERTEALAEYCRKHIIRVYPAGQRFDSSNFDPLPGWCAGVQCVALNVQKNSPAVWISYGKFRNNGGCGFLLKPPTLRRNAARIPEPLTFRVKILSGHYLIPSFQFRDSSQPTQVPSEVYVEVSVHGCKADTVAFRTRAVKRNCFNPAWNQVTHFPIQRPDLAHVLFVVKDQDGQVFCQSSTSLDCIRQGFRVVPLATPSCAPSNHSYLFCKFDILSYEDHLKLMSEDPIK